MASYNADIASACKGRQNNAMVSKRRYTHRIRKNDLSSKGHVDLFNYLGNIICFPLSGSLCKT